MGTPTTTVVNGPTSQPSGISELLEARGVRSAMVIDDSLDAGPEQWKDLLPEVRDQIQEFIEDRAELREWLQQEELLPPDSAIAPEAEKYLEKLKQRVDEREDLSILWHGIIEPSIGMAREEVETLIKCLRDVGIRVQPSGIRDPKDPPADVSVIFIDYTLEDTDSGNVATKSIEEINRIHDALKTVLLQYSVWRS